MKLRAKVPIAAILLGFGLGNVCFADLVKGDDLDEQTVAITAIGHIDETYSAIEIPESIIPVPEPATFGVVSLALAICGGLLVRNKRPGF